MPEKYLDKNNIKPKTGFHYSSVQPGYAQRYLEPKILRLLRSEKGKVLEIGCGKGKCGQAQGRRICSDDVWERVWRNIREIMKFKYQDQDEDLDKEKGKILFPENCGFTGSTLAKKLTKEGREVCGMGNFLL